MSLVTPGDSARVHGEFFNDPTPTDVMTFMHGEIIICPQVANQQRSMEKLGLHDEILTYLIHGLLHLCGLDDQKDGDFIKMAATQKAIREKVAD